MNSSWFTLSTWNKDVCMAHVCGQEVKQVRDEGPPRKCFYFCTLPELRYTIWKCWLGAMKVFQSKSVVAIKEVTIHFVGSSRRRKLMSKLLLPAQIKPSLLSLTWPDLAVQRPLSIYVTNAIPNLTMPLSSERDPSSGKTNITSAMLFVTTIFNLVTLNGRFAMWAAHWRPGGGHI